MHGELNDVNRLTIITSQVSFLTVETSPRCLLFLRSFSTFWMVWRSRVFRLVCRRASLLSVRGGTVLLPACVTRRACAQRCARAGGVGRGAGDGVRVGHGDHRCGMQTIVGVRGSVRMLTACLGRQDCRRARYVGMSVGLVLSSSVLHVHPRRIR